MSKLIELTQGYCAIVDDEDYEFVSRFNWRVRYTPRGVYVQRGDGIYLHRVVMDAPHGLDVDHINHQPLDCRKSNLRLCTHSQNLANRKGPNSNNTSGVRGVIWNKEKRKWQAQSKVKGKKLHFGYFHKLEDAARAYATGMKRHFGEFCGTVDHV